MAKKGAKVYAWKSLNKELKAGLDHWTIETERKKIFSGVRSEPMWEMINTAKTKKQLRDALYVVCCRLQDLESKLDKE